MTNLFQLGDFTLSSGIKSEFKIDCDALTDEDIETIAKLISRIVRPFHDVAGVPRGGLRLAKAMEKYAIEFDRTSYILPRMLVVDDVWTTGKSLDTVCARKLAYQGAVIFARAPLHRISTEVPCVALLQLTTSRV